MAKKIILDLIGDVFMDSLELLSKQIQQYQDQNQKQLQSYQDQNQHEHELLSQKIQQLLTEVHVLYSERNLNEDKFARLEQGQEEIKESTSDIDKRLKTLEEHQLKRKFGWDLFLKVIGAVATIAAILGVIAKLFNIV